ncbi:Protein Dok-7 [Dissostichus eleginoides]|uniref:Protein Dok-7 n=1 Tax=Dissostichus eleginoides TaxID=100907 RepID=A0AAD9BRR1_DISEL|nr:Protein Dok-7 [Dissostichus eleginoides]
MTDTVVAEGQVKFRDGKKWKSRCVVLRKPSPVADCLSLLVYKEKKKKKGKRENGSGHKERLNVTLEGICGVEPGPGYDGVSYSLSILCLAQTLVLGFNSREALLAWDTRIRYSLGEVHRLCVNVEPGTKLESGPASLHLCNDLLVLTRGVPPVVIGHWKLSALRRYGAVPNGFVFEGGTRCGYCRPMPENLELNQVAKAGYVRHFQASNWERYPWLTGSVSHKRLYCWECLLFGTEKGAWNWKGYDNLSCLTKAAQKHQNTAGHLKATVTVKTFGDSRIDLQLDEQRRRETIMHNEKVNTNREILKRLIHCVIFLGKQELPFRGHDESRESANRGNYLELLTFLAEYDPDLHYHLSTSKVFIGTLSQIQNDLISAVAEVMGETIKEEISKALMLDETSDVSNAAQLSCVLRFVTDSGVKERFVKFEDVTGKKRAEDVAAMALGFLEEHGCMDKLVAQCYDGAAVMASGLNGVQAKFTSFNSKFPATALSSLTESYGPHFDLPRLKTELSVMYGAGVFFLSCSEGEQISFLFDCIVRGITPSRTPHGLRPVLPDLNADPASAEERLSLEASELEKRLSMLSQCSLASSTASTYSCSTSVAGDDQSSISSSSSSQSDTSYGSRLSFRAEPLARPHIATDTASSCSTLKARSGSDDRLFAAVMGSSGPRPPSAQLHLRGLNDSGRQSSLDSGIGVAAGSQSSYSGSYSSYTGSLDMASQGGEGEFGSGHSEDYQIPSLLRLWYDTPRSLLQSLSLREPPLQQGPPELGRDSRRGVEARGSQGQRLTNSPPGSRAQRQAMMQRSHSWGSERAPPVEGEGGSTPRPLLPPGGSVSGETQCGHGLDNYITPEQWRSARNRCLSQVARSPSSPSPSADTQDHPLCVREEQDDTGVLSATLCPPASACGLRPTSAWGMIQSAHQAPPSVSLESWHHIDSTVNYVNIPISPLPARTNRELLYTELDLQDPHSAVREEGSIRYAHLDIAAMETAQRVGAEHVQGREDRLSQLERRRGPPN